MGRTARATGIVAAAFLISVFCGQAGAPPGPAPDQDVSAFASGGLIASSTSDYPGYEASYLLDESPKAGWSTNKGAKGPFVIVISLAEKSEIHALVFDTASVDQLPRAAKDVDIAVSDISASDGFAPAAGITLKDGADNQAFRIKPIAGRWIRLTVKSNYGDPSYTEIMDVRAMGRMLTQSPMPTGLSGTYSTVKYGRFHLLQKGSELTGCYEDSGGLIQGGLEAHLMRLTWTEGSSSGPAVMVLKRDGKGFVGWWHSAGATAWNQDWDLTKVSDQVGSCPNWNPNGSVISDELKDQGRSRLYGINFDATATT